MKKQVNRAASLRINVLALALVAGVGFAGSALGQATTGSIFGQAPMAADTTIVIKNASGLARQATIDAQGRYALDALPLGTYTVTLLRDGQVVDTRSNVTLRVGAGTEVSFGSAKSADDVTELDRVVVSASAPATIDVTGVDSRTVITSEQLARLPIARNAEAIAMLAPGVVAGSDFFTGPTGGQLISMGGSSVTENAYYINGFNTTDPLSGFGGFALPYGSIDQQEILNGGYGAPYGRSDGGVISQVGKRGTNTWKFGGQVEWTPAFLRGDQRDIYYAKGARAGQIQNRNADDKSWTRVISTYAGGPLVEDKLFLFASIESERREGSSIGAVTSPYKTQERNDYPKWYAKLDWNINDSNILELTGAYTERSYQGDLYDYSYATGLEGAFSSHAQSTKTSAKIYTAKFTSYVTDDLTLSAMYGQMRGTYFNENPGYDATHAFVYGPSLQNPLFTGGSSIQGPQTIDAINDPTHTTNNTNLRLDASYRLGSHTLAAGIDNQMIDDTNDRNYIAGPGYAWEYDKGQPGTPIIGVPGDDPWVDAPGSYAGGAGGYFVSKYVRSGGGSVRVEQRAQYIEDTWQVNNNWLAKFGLRNDQFINYNPSGEAYLRLTSPQWAPRLGFSWDVNGDSSFKVYGNVGRYFLALPATVAMRQAGNPLYTREYYTYTGIDSNGAPTGLTPIANSRNGPISANREYGQTRDPRLVAATNLESEHQDEIILGFDRRLGASWVYGAKAIYRNLRTAIDDYGDSGAIIDKLNALGIDPNSYDPRDILGAYLINPGQNADLNIKMKDGSYRSITMTPTEMFGFPARYKRSYYGLNLYLEHPFDGTWMGKIDYLHSRSYGNSEGQVRSDIGQVDVSATVDWDYGQVMEYANGELSNSIRHQLKAYGAYQVTPEWMVSGNMAILSGAPRSCLGMYGPDQTNPGLGYGSYYHWCDGKPSRPGDAGHNPWQYIFSLGTEYRPAWADKKLGFNVIVHNIFNNRETTQTNARPGAFTNGIPARVDYLRPVSQSTPRYIRFGISYDF